MSKRSVKIVDPIGKKLQESLDERNISVPELAKRLGMPKDRIYKWTRGLASPKYADRELLEKWLSSEDWENFHIKSGNSRGLAIETSKESMAKEIIHLKAVVKAQGALLVKIVAAYYNRPVQDVMKELRDNATLIILDQDDR